MLNVCDPITECRRCKNAETCDRFFDFEGFLGLRKKDAAGDDEDKPKRPTLEVDAKGEFVYKNSQGETIDRLTFLQLDIDAMNALDHEDEDDEDDEMDGRDVLEALRTARQLDKTFEREE